MQASSNSKPRIVIPHYESEALCIVMKNSFHSYANETNFHMKSFALQFRNEVQSNSDCQPVQILGAGGPVRCCLGEKANTIKN